MRKGSSFSGVVTLVVIFCVLCLSVFAVLTVATVQREHTLSLLTAERATAYYEADSKACGILKEVLDGGSPEEVAFTETSDGRLASFSVAAGGEQELQVSVLLAGKGAAQNAGAGQTGAPEDAGAGDAYRILSWKLAYAGGWEADEQMDLFGGFEDSPMGLALPEF